MLPRSRTLRDYFLTFYVISSLFSRGSKLRIVSSTLTLGARSMSARTEIWDATHQRLVASGVHVKMDASAAKPQSKL
jgi:acyl-coenzyme A thioesterase 13